jgi:hypothetical protein
VLLRESIVNYCLFASVTLDDNLVRSICCLQTAILETNPYLLGLTIVVSLVHSVFEFLAFKNG